MHLCATKAYVIDHIRRSGAALVLGDVWAGRDEEAIAAVAASPGQVIPVGGKCDNFDPETGCNGHESDEASK